MGFMDMYEIEHFYDRLQVLEHMPPTREKGSLSPEDRLRAMNGPLLEWYENNARILPWREEPEPYRVWISEIMLQQTRVEAVKPYFERFLDEIPDIKALSEAPEERLLKLWEGLGYYNRARNLQKAAKMIVDEFGGRIPDHYDSLLKLPGIGSYTAGAIASIAYGVPVPAVDGNVLRVISRVLASREDILKQSVKSQMEKALKETMPADRASAFNQGLIEIGAIVCVPNGSPKCKECPLAAICLAGRQGLTGEIPVKTPKKPRRIEEKTVLIIVYESQVAIRKREDKGLLASLYELPTLDGHLSQNQMTEALSLPPGAVEQIDVLPAAKHIFSHVEWHMTGYRVVLREGTPGLFMMVEKEALSSRYPLPNAFAAYRKLL